MCENDVYTSPYTDELLYTAQTSNRHNCRCGWYNYRTPESTLCPIFLYIGTSTSPCSHNSQHTLKSFSTASITLAAAHSSSQSITNGASQHRQGLLLRADAGVGRLGCHGLRSGDRARARSHGWSGLLFASKWRRCWSVTYGLILCLVEALLELISL